MNKKRGGDCARDIASRQKAKNSNRNFLKENREQRSEQAQSESDDQSQDRRRLLDDVRGNFHTDSETDRGYAEPEQPSSEEQYHDADEYAYDCCRGVHRRKSGLNSHICKRVI